MARSIRLEYAGAFYHVMARGNRKNEIFVDDDDRRFFLKCLSEVCKKTGWNMHAWVLMPNHYHLFIETPEANLVEGMKWLQNTVTRRFNARHREWGRLFGDRYKAVVVEGESRNYYETLWDYIHLNPCRAGLVDVTKGQSVLDYRWSSLVGGYTRLPHQRAKWLAAEKGLSILGVEDTVEGRRCVVERLDLRALQEREQSGWVALDPAADQRGSHLRRGWYWGSLLFAEKIMKLGETALGKNRKARGYESSLEKLAHGEQAAMKLLSEGLEAAGVETGDLLALAYTDPVKALLADLLWKKTTVSQGWIAEHLKMKNAANVSRAINRISRQDLKMRVSDTLNAFVEAQMGEIEH